MEILGKKEVGQTRLARELVLMPRVLMSGLGLPPQQLGDTTKEGGLLSDAMQEHLAQELTSETTNHEN